MGDVIGEVVVGGQKIVEKLGEGGLGIVYRAEDQMLGRLTAVKMLRTRVEPEQRDRSAVLQRSQSRRGASPHRHRRDLCVRLPRRWGRRTSSWSSWMVRASRRGSRKRPKLAVDDAVRTTRNVCSALSAAHAKQIVHRDLKPDNIFLVPDADFPGGRAHQNFGFRHRQALRRWRSGRICHPNRRRLRHAGPSWLLSSAEVQRTLTSALTCTRLAASCFACSRLTCRSSVSSRATSWPLKFRDLPPSPREMDPAIPAALEALVLRLLEKKPKDRYQSARELRDALDQLDMQTQGQPTPGACFDSHHAARSRAPERAARADSVVSEGESDRGPGRFDPSSGSDVRARARSLCDPAGASRASRGTANDTRARRRNWQPLLREAAREGEGQTDCWLESSGFLLSAVAPRRSSGSPEVAVKVATLPTRAVTKPPAPPDAAPEVGPERGDLSGQDVQSQRGDRKERMGSGLDAGQGGARRQGGVTPTRSRSAIAPTRRSKRAKSWRR